jgi:hypothetical protein
VLIFSELIAVMPFKSKADALAIGEPKSAPATSVNIEINAGRNFFFLTCGFEIIQQQYSQTLTSGPDCP